QYGGYSLKDLNLVKGGAIPKDCSILLINAPTTDITDSEIKLLSEYMDNGGRVFITLAITLEKMPNLDSILANYGIADSRRMIIEGSADYVYQQNPYYISPQLSAEHPISARLSETKTSAFVPFSVAINTLDVVRSTVKVDPFATSSPYSYSKALEQMSSYEKAETDPEGPFNIGVTITDVDKAGNEEGVKLVVFGAETVMESDINKIVNGGNYGVVMNALDWLVGNDTLLRSKSLGAEDYLQLTQSKAIVIMFVSVILIPLSIIIAGIVVVVRRRNR
ncbi:MAG: Gldg family protein, partial [Lachnospiraceae bacterium]|nr:Gldg family protein [Lachnospiraceae bacterium]